MNEVRIERRQEQQTILLNSTYIVPHLEAYRVEQAPKSVVSSPAARISHAILFGLGRARDVFHALVLVTLWLCLVDSV